MNCPYCQTVNRPGDRFCMKCGKLLSEMPAAPPAGERLPPPVANSYPQLFWLLTGRVIIAILLLFLFRRVFVGLAFTQNLAIPDFPLTVPQIITSLVNLAVLALLLGYAPAMRALWPKAYPRLAFLTPALMALVYVWALSVAYTALIIPVYLLVDNPDVGLVIQVLWTLAALALLGYAWLAVYQELPTALRSIRLDLTLGRSSEVACLRCGRLNPAGTTNCTHCGQTLTHPTMR